MNKTVLSPPAAPAVTGSHRETISEVWGRAKGMAFWDLGKLEYDSWSRMFTGGNANIVRQSINFMHPADLIQLMGRERFIKDWPQLRQGTPIGSDVFNVSIHAPRGANLEEITPSPYGLYPPEGEGFKPKRVFNENKHVILDAAWSLFVVGDATFRMNPCVLGYHPKKIATFRTLIKQRDRLSIYQIAKMLERNYRRVFDDINDFVIDGLVVLETEVRNGRACKIPRVFGIHVRHAC